MIYVRIELWPGGNSNARKLLGEATIANVSGLAPISDYQYQLYGKERAPMGFGTHEKFPRNRLHVWDLLYRILRQARGKRSGDVPKLQLDRNGMEKV